MNSDKKCLLKIYRNIRKIFTSNLKIAIRILHTILANCKYFCLPHCHDHFTKLVSLPELSFCM